MKKFWLNSKETAYILIDVQERLAPAMSQSAETVKNCKILLEMVDKLNIPIVEMRQYPKGLGDTLPELKAVLNARITLNKTDFSAFKTAELQQFLRMLQPKNIVINGMEAHVCLLQTVLELLENGYNVHVVADASASRRLDDKAIALELMRDAGAVITTTETVLFQLIGSSQHEHFKALSSLVK